jgi:class 3 adenylate cyclase
MGTSYQPIQFLEGKIPFLPIVMTVRLKDAKTPFGYVWTTLDLRPLSKSLEKLYTRRTLLTMELDSVYVIDKEFRIIAHSHAQKLGHKSAEEIKKNIGTMVNNNLTWKIDFQQEGQRYLASIQILEQLVWGVVAQQSQTGLRNYLRGILTKSIVIAAICLLIALIAGLWFGYRISKPIRQIASAAGAVASGNFEVQVEVRSRDEVGELGQSFNKMAVDLQTYRQQMIEETRIRTDLGRYISSELVEGIVQNKISVQLGGEKRKITVMFADIVAFTALSERHKPEQIVAVLNELFTFFTEIIFRHGGTIDKFIGDCVMAVFGAPYDHPDDALRAVRAAEEMTRWLEVGNARWQKTLGSSLQMGIGIHTGEVIAGNIGSQKRMEYTVIGDTVNIAAHLESLARPGQILMTAATTREIKHQFNCVSLGQFPIKGHHQPFDIFALDEE